MKIQKIFFSYSRADGSDFALRLALDLKSKGFDAWIDQEDIRAGSEWDIEIEKALQTCDCLLFIETEKSVASNNVLDEVYYALEQQKKVIPLIFIDSTTPFRLRRLQHIDFTKDYNSGLSLLVNELKYGSSAEAVPPGNSKLLMKADKTFWEKYSKLILLITSILVITAVAIVYIATDTHVPPTEKDNVAMSTKTFTGDWQLVDVDPKARLKSGYLKIEALDEKKVTIKSYLQFYYFKTNEPSYLSVFNAFAGCPACSLEKDMKITAEDVAIGSATIKVLKADQADGGRAGDTVMNAVLNKSIHASVTLHFTDTQTAIIKVQQSGNIVLADDLVLRPFVYSFHFKKNE